MHTLALFRRLVQNNVKTTPTIYFGIETLRSYAGLVGGLKQNEEKETPNFKNVISERKKEANKSVLVQVHSEQSCHSLLSYLNRISQIKHMLHYQSLNNSHFVLIELESIDDMNNMLDHAIHFQPHEVVPVQSPFMWFRASNEIDKSVNTTTNNLISYHNSISIEEKEKIDNYLLNAESISQQMLLLHDKTRITELGTRLRFLTAKQIEMGLRGLFPDINVTPFGSSVNGFGKNDCDLDLVMNYSNKIQTDKSRMIYHAKSSLINERIQTQHHIEIIADIIQLFMPGCTSVKKILQARVPIIKYKQDLTCLECDVCMSNSSAVQMSELLYTYSMMDDKVKYLIFTIRYWAKAVGLTNSSPGRWISNFSLTLMVLFFLQQKQFLPSLNNLRKEVKSSSSASVTSELSCEKLLKEFLEYYSNFDFGSHALSLITGTTVLKPDYSALYIVNPLQPELNVSKNVSFEEIEHLKIEVRIALGVLDEFGEVRKENWGLVKLFEKSNVKMFKGKHRLIDVQSLFDEKVPPEVLKPS